MDQLMKVRFTGHPNVLATNRMTLEVTREDFLTPRGDCIIGILADSACAGLSEVAKEALRSDGSKILFRIQVGDERYEFVAHGSSALQLSHPMSMVIRKSSYVSDRTLAVKSEAAACDVPRSLVARLAKGATGELAAFSV